MCTYFKITNWRITNSIYFGISGGGKLFPVTRPSLIFKFLPFFLFKLSMDFIIVFRSIAKKNLTVVKLEFTWLLSHKITPLERGSPYTWANIIHSENSSNLRKHNTIGHCWPKNIVLIFTGLIFTNYYLLFSSLKYHNLFILWDCYKK